MVACHRRKLNRVGDELINLIFNNEVIKRVEKIKYSGINITKRIKWEEQYKNIKKKFKVGISPLRKLKDILSKTKALTSV